MTNRLWWAMLVSSSPRYAAWKEIFGCDAVPLKTPGSTRADLGEEKNVEIYQLDFRAVTPEQKARLISWLSSKFVDPREEIEREIDREGFPIRAADVTVSFSMRAFL